ncbi:MAG TPA: lipoprotein [Parvibaculum sp.]|jgi:predicted small lipoprotein YifL
MNKRLTMAITAFAVILALGACGRKGPLEPPPGVSPDMASAKVPGCAPASPASPASAAGQRPIDATPPSGSETGNPNRMPDMANQPC